MMRFLADRFMEETGGNASNLRGGYAMAEGLNDTIYPYDSGKCAGWSGVTPWMLGTAGMACMVDETCRILLDDCYNKLVDFDVSGNPHNSLAKAYYLMHMTGLMDFAIE